MRAPGPVRCGGVSEAPLVVVVITSIMHGKLTLALVAIGLLHASRGVMKKILDRCVHYLQEW